ncbi:MAG: tRNA (adenosine(37)-N6)-dimethylallyltransferase MiaA [candidate division Zixibacteria bacterium]|nr:tRNA (adenosine(37)-N6)-dimethylallyltransferase MiaA [candidate division Zixibacteria bacterium]
MSNSAGNKLRLPVLTGPTGAGKTALAYRLMDSLPNIELISADSRQIYKQMAIGTDKPTAEERAKYSMHLVDCVEPGDRYTAYDFVSDARRLIADILIRGKYPLICGGTGLYLKSLIEGIVELPEDDLHIRTELEELAVTRGPKFLYEQLEEIDPLEARKTHPNNIKRIIRALEIYRVTGKSKSEVLAEPLSETPPYDFEVLCYMPPREILYERINTRVDRMMETGLEQEARQLAAQGLKDMVEKVNVIGYHELFSHFDGEIPRETAVNLIKQNTRRFAKRQITWFKGMPYIAYFADSDTILNRLKTLYASINI